MGEVYMRSFSIPPMKSDVMALTKEISLSEVSRIAARILSSEAPASPGYLSGEAGIILFLTACHFSSTGKDRVIGSLIDEGRYQRRKKESILRMKKYVLMDLPDSEISWSLADGLFGILHVLLLIDRLYPDPEISSLLPLFMERACDYMPGDKVYCDIYLGIAGVISVLAECLAHSQYHRNGSSSERQLLMSLSFILEGCLDRILELKDCSSDSGIWDTLLTGHPVSGYGHGMAGIGSAILRGLKALLSIRSVSVQKQRLLQEAADSAFAFELRAFSKLLNEWPDLRPSKDPGKSLGGICSGAPGIAFGTLPFADHDALAEELYTVACRSLIDNPPVKRDHLCCGKASAAAFFLSDPPRFNSEDAGMRAGHILSLILLDKDKNNGSYILPDPVTGPIDTLSLFFGSAGIGMTLLAYGTGILFPGLFP